jgi:hypothetical protein
MNVFDFGITLQKKHVPKFVKRAPGALNSPKMVGPPSPALEEVIPPPEIFCC